MDHRQLSIIVGVSYLVIFFSAIYANFFVLDALLHDPLGTVTTSGMQVRLGALAFLVAAVFDVIVAWGLFELYKENVLTRLSTCFRLMHATIMGAAVYALPLALSMENGEAILGQVTIFNTLWLIGLFFFGVHLILLGRIATNIPYIPYTLMLAGAMYIIDTSAHFVLVNYDAYADTFLILVAVPAILGEMSLALWFIWRGGKEQSPA